VKKMITEKGKESRKNCKKNGTRKEITLHAELRHNDRISPYAGLAAGKMVVRKLGLAEEIDENLSLFKQYHDDYTESTHILTATDSMLAGGNRLQSINDIRHSGGTQRLNKSQKMVAPTTMGDTLHRFSEEDIWTLQEINLKACSKVWEQCCGKKKGSSTFTIDTDASLKPVYGNCFEGADFNYKGAFSYHPEYVTRAETGEILMVQNRRGNAKSGSGVEKLLERVYPTVKKHFRKIRHRGDSKYGKKAIIQIDEKYGVTFYLGYESCGSLIEAAEKIPERTWAAMPLKPAETRRKRTSRKKRAKQKRYRRQKVKARGFKDAQTAARHVSEVHYKPSWSAKAYRIIVVRSSREIYEGEKFLFGRYDYYFIITNDHRRSALTVATCYYQRDNQENIIKQIKYDTGGLWMPSKTLLANWAWMAINALAWNIKSWICQLGFKQGLRWMWHRFCRELMLITATVTHESRQVKVYVNNSHRYASALVNMINDFACLDFT
jgi:hypothetical protein